MSANIKATNTEAIIGVGGVDQMTVSNAGVVTANSFVGNVTGNVTGGGTFSGNASSATALATGSTAARTLANRFADYYYVADFATGDLAARAAFDARKPLNVLSGESAKIICNPTAGDDFKAMCLWFAQCNKAEDATFFIQLADGGHTVNTYVELYNTNIAVDLRGSATWVEEENEILISSISYGTIDIVKRVTATVTLSTPIPASYSVGDPVGMQNIQGNNDATSASGGQIIKSIASNRLSFTFDFFSPKGQPISPTILNNPVSITSLLSGGSTTATATTNTPHGYTAGQVVTITGATPADYNGSKSLLTASGSTVTYAVISGLLDATGTIIASQIVNGIVNNKALFPNSWLRCDPAWMGGNIEGFINLYTGSRMTMRYIGLKYNGYGQVTDGTYTQSGTTVTVTTTSNHGLTVGTRITSNILTGTAVTGVYGIQTTTPTTFTYTALTSLTTSGNLILNRPDERDMLFAKNNGSFFYLYDKVVIAGTGDKNIRLYNQAGIYINRSCIGSAAKGDRWLDIANGCTAVAVRSSFGGAGEHGVSVGDGSVLTLTSCILGSANRAIYSIGANASIAFDASQISNAIAGIYASEGSVNCSTNPRIQRSTTGVSVTNDAGFVFGTNNITFTSVTTEVLYVNKSWTPVFSGIATPTYTVQSGEYTQIGSLIFCSAKITVSLLDNTDTSAIQIQMPIAPNPTYTAASIQIDTINSDLLTTTSRNAVLGAYFSSGSIVFSTGTTTLKYTGCNASGTFIFSVTYSV